jgi:hypothetical protein
MLHPKHSGVAFRKWVISARCFTEQPTYSAGYSTAGAAAAAVAAVEGGGEGEHSDTFPSVGDRKSGVERAFRQLVGKVFAWHYPDLSLSSGPGAAESGSRGKAQFRDDDHRQEQEEDEVVARLLLSRTQIVGGGYEDSRQERASSSLSSSSSSRATFDSLTVQRSFVYLHLSHGAHNNTHTGVLSVVESGTSSRHLKEAQFTNSPSLRGKRGEKKEKEKKEKEKEKEAQSGALHMAQSGHAAHSRRLSSSPLWNWVFSFFSPGQGKEKEGETSIRNEKKEGGPHTVHNKRHRQNASALLESPKASAAGDAPRHKDRETVRISRPRGDSSDHGEGEKSQLLLTQGQQQQWAQEQSERESAAQHKELVRERRRRKVARERLEQELRVGRQQHLQ